MKNYIIAVDEGTTSVRSVLFDVKKKKIVYSSKQTFKQIYPSDGYVEHDAEEIWRKTQKTLHDVLGQINPKDVYGIGITNQRETVVMWNKKTGKPIYNAIVWQCRRTVDFVESHLKGQVGKKIHTKTGLIPDAYFSATKIKWLLENVKEAKVLEKKNELAVGTIESFLAFKLTGNHITDITNASRTMLLNINTKVWDDELLKLFNINEEILPKVINNDQIVGYYNYNGVSLTVAGLIGDQQSSLFGQACFKKGDLKNTYGTGSFLLLNIGDKPLLSKHKLLTTIAWSIKGKTTYALEGSVFNCGSSIEWLKDIGFISSPAECDQLAESVQSSNGVYFVPAFTGLGAPYWDGKARAMFCGITRAANKANMVRAVLDSVAFSVKDVYDIMFEDASSKKGAIRVDGGVTKCNFIMQYQSNLLGREIKISAEKESTSLGAIFMCGLSVGVWKNLKELGEISKISKTFKPKKSLNYMNEKYAGWQDAIKKAQTKRG